MGKSLVSCFLTHGVDRDCKNTWFSLRSSPCKSSTTDLATHLSANEYRRNYQGDRLGPIAYNFYPRDATLARVL